MLNHGLQRELAALSLVEAHGAADLPLPEGPHYACAVGSMPGDIVIGFGDGAPVGPDPLCAYLKEASRTRGFQPPIPFA
jgi:hypothetical protein